MSQTDLTSDNYSYDSPPSYDAVCSSDTTGEQSSTTYGFSAAPDNNWTESHEITTQSFGDRNDSTEGYSSTTREFSNGNEINANDNTTQDPTPTAPISEDVGGGVSGYVRPEDRDDVVIPICGTSVYSGIPDYSRTREYNNRVIPSRIERYRYITPRQNVQFERDCHNLNQVDTSKLSNAEFLNWVDKYQRVLNAEERRQSNEKCKYRLLKGLLWFSVALVIIGVFIGITRTGTRSSSNRYLHGQGYIRNQEESDVDRLFRLNPYLNGQRSYDDLRESLAKDNAELKKLLDDAKSQNDD